MATEFNKTFSGYQSRQLVQRRINKCVEVHFIISELKKFSCLTWWYDCHTKPVSMNIANVWTIHWNKGHASPVQAWTGPEGSRRLRLPGFLNSRNKKVVRLSDLRTGRLYSSGDAPGTHVCWRLTRTQRHSAAGRGFFYLPKISN